VFSNHYHFVGLAEENANSVQNVVRDLHSCTARWVNKLDGMQGRRVWYQFWDRCLTYERSYYARLNYVTQNAVHHGVVKVASQYPFCSAWAFEREATSAFRRKISSYSYDRIKEPDDFAPLGLLDLRKS
jgi:putative transposase